MADHEERLKCSRTGYVLVYSVWAVIRSASLDAHAAAREKKEADIVFTAYAAGQAVVRHMS